MTPEQITQINTELTDGMGTFYGIAVAIFGILASIYGVRKVINLMNKS